MYEAPLLERYGTFRELTRGGFSDIADGFTANSVDACRVVQATDPITGLPIEIITCIRSGQ